MLILRTTGFVQGFSRIRGRENDGTHGNWPNSKIPETTKNHGMESGAAIAFAACLVFLPLPLFLFTSP